MKHPVMPWGVPVPVMPGRSKNQGRYYGSGRDWETPPDLFATLDAEFGFTLDPCCKPSTAKCARYFTEDDDGLAHSWAGEVVFMNPPYGSLSGIVCSPACGARRSPWRSGCIGLSTGGTGTR